MILGLQVTQVHKQLNIMKCHISKWFKIFRTKIVEWIINNTQDWENQIGGENEIVEIDEAKLGKRKYNKGCKYILI